LQRDRRQSRTCRLQSPGRLLSRSWCPTGGGTATYPEISKLIGNWELFIGFLLVFIMLAGEKGIWGSLQPLLEKLVSRKKAAADTADGAGESRP
jgi:hypothetical protein